MKLKRLLCVFTIFYFISLPISATVTGTTTISMAFVSQVVDRRPVLSNLIEEPDDLGLQGARLALKDNNITGRFTKQAFLQQEVILSRDENVAMAVNDLVSKGQKLFILDLPLFSIKSVLKAVKEKDILFFNSRAKENELRQNSCDTRLLHTIPSRAMLGDALTQYLVKKRWKKWQLISGPKEGDQKFAAALKKSAVKFGATIVEEKNWDGARDARRTAQAEVPLLTQGKDYDILIVADEWGDFGEYLIYRTFDPRPVAGTQGLFPTGWFWTQEQWGATQLQKRFKRLAKRPMEERDYAAWAAVRSVGEAATRAKSVDIAEINKYIRSDSFELAAFKGRKLSYRKWNGQLRQPIALSTARSLVAQAPLEGFIHKQTELDTLGFDQPESKCKEFLK